MLTQAPRGTKDVTPEASAAWQHIEAHIRAACANAGYREARTPVFEHTELFLRGVGDTTDIVQKEMYTFEDKGGRSVTLKPEGTAGVARMLVEHKLYAGALPVKIYYLNTPVFRYERPGSGRLREHHQFGVEAFGAAAPSVDAEQIALFWDLMARLGLRGLCLRINSIGCPACRPAYQETLKVFLAGRLDRLCGDCKDRFHRNPLRILDCKLPDCRAGLAGAPVILDCLCGGCQAHFDTLRSLLDAMGIPFAVDPGIVRGLDYYTRTVFEVIAGEEDGSLAVGGGGRYDGLVEQIGGPALPGVGFGMGMERVLMLTERQKTAPTPPNLADVYICTQGEAAWLPAVGLMTALRRAGVRADVDHMTRSLKAQFKHADRCGARFVAILGERELEESVATLRDMFDGTQRAIPLDSAAEAIRASLDSH